MSSLGASVVRNERNLLNRDGDVGPIASDLLSFCSEAFLTDRAHARGKNPDDPRWHRQLELTVPVQRRAAWAKANVHETAQQLLEWLTDDRWTVQFVPASERVEARQLQLDVDPLVRTVMLFSGGLDAVAGAATMLERTPLLAVGVVTNPAMRGYQARTYRALCASGLGNIRYCPVDFNVVGSDARDDEPTRRTRGLVFLGVGVAAALQHEASGLIVAENGVGALNLPFTEAQSGAMTSRSVHPHTLRLMSRLVEALTEVQFSIENPFLGQTKGEMVRSLPPAARDACAASESCDNAAAGRGQLERRCGHCTSCLLRRLSFHAASRTDWDSRPYLADTTIREHRWTLPEVLYQAARIDRALSRGGIDALHDVFPELRLINPDDMTSDAISRLLRTYVDEWRQYPDAHVSQFLQAASPSNA